MDNNKSDTCAGWVSRLCDETGWSITKLSRTYGIPLRTLFNWNKGAREAPDYVRRLIERVAREDSAKVPNK